MGYGLRAVGCRRDRGGRLMPKVHRNRAPSYPVGVLPESPAEPAAEQGPEEDAPSPPTSATRTKWAAYAAELGVDVEGLTKAQIRKKVRWPS